jgi:hypothetical protein
MRCEASRAVAARSADGERKRPGSASRSRCSAASPFPTLAVAATGPSRSIAVVAREGLRTAGTGQAKRDGKVFVRVLEETMVLIVFWKKKKIANIVPQTVPAVTV